jgi:hypothetical protein
VKTFLVKKKRDSERRMEEAGKNNPCVQEVLQIVMQYASAFASLSHGERKCSPRRKSGTDFSHKSREEDGKTTNKTTVWIGDKLW